MASRNHTEFDDEGYEDLKDRIEALERGGVTIGVHSKDNARRDDGEMTMARLLAIHELGAEVEDSAYGDITIPPRPVLRGTMRDREADIDKLLGDRLEAQIDGRITAWQMWSQIGAKLKGYVQSRFGSDELASNAPATIENKGSARPLIDDGDLRQSIDYVVHQTSA